MASPTFEVREKVFVFSKGVFYESTIESIQNGKVKYATFGYKGSFNTNIASVRKVDDHLRSTEYAQGVTVTWEGGTRVITDNTGGASQAKRKKPRGKGAAAAATPASPPPGDAGGALVAYAGDAAGDTAGDEPDVFADDAARGMLTIDIPDTLYDYLARQEAQITSRDLPLPLALPAETRHPSVHTLLVDFLHAHEQPWAVGNGGGVTERVCADRCQGTPLFRFVRTNDRLLEGRHLTGATATVGPPSSSSSSSSSSLSAGPPPRYKYDLRETLMMLLSHFDDMLVQFLCYPAEHDLADYLTRDCAVCECRAASTGTDAAPAPTPCRCAKSPPAPSDVFGAAHLVRALQKLPAMLQLDSLRKDLDDEFRRIDAEGPTALAVNGGDGGFARAMQQMQQLKEQKKRRQREHRAQQWAQVKNSLVHYTAVFNDLLAFIAAHAATYLPPPPPPGLPFLTSGVRRPQPLPLAFGGTSLGGRSPAGYGAGVGPPPWPAAVVTTEGAVRNPHAAPPHEAFALQARARQPTDSPNQVMHGAAAVAVASPAAAAPAPAAASSSTPIGHKRKSSASPGPEADASAGHSSGRGRNSRHGRHSSGSGSSAIGTGTGSGTGSGSGSGSGTGGRSRTARDAATTASTPPPRSPASSSSSSSSSTSSALASSQATTVVDGDAPGPPRTSDAQDAAAAAHAEAAAPGPGDADVAAAAPAPAPIASPVAVPIEPGAAAAAAADAGKHCGSGASGSGSSSVSGSGGGSSPSGESKTRRGSRRSCRSDG